jgi:hypothetical protein
MNNSYYLTADVINYLTAVDLTYTTEEFRKDHGDREIEADTLRNWFVNFLGVNAASYLLPAMERELQLWTRQGEITGAISEYACIRG